MDARLAGLKRPQAAEVKPSFGDIKDYLSGKGDLSQANMDLNFYSNINTQYQTEPRSQKTEKDVVNMLNDLQKNKEAELKTAIEKEEFSRKYQGKDYRQLEQIANQKQQEAYTFGAQGDAINSREQALRDEVAKLEADLVTKESNYAGINDFSQQNYDNLQANVRQRENERQIQSYAEQRAQNIAKVKSERDRLEQERALIKQQLGGLQAEGGTRVNSRGSNFRQNQAAQRASSGILRDTPSKLSNKRPEIDNDLKARLNYDQQRINDLKKSQQNLLLNNPVNAFDDVDILQRELQRQPNYYSEVQKLTEDYSTRNIPKKDELLGDIRRQLEDQSAAPRSIPQTNFKTGEYQTEPRDQNYNKKTDNDLLSRLDDLEGLLVKKSPNKRGRPPKPDARPPPAPQQPQVYAQAQPQYVINPLTGQPVIQQQPYLVPQQPQDQYFAQQLQQPQYVDPSLNQFANLLQTQQKENNQLKEVLENFGKQSATVDQLDGTIDQATQQLLTLKQDPRAAVNPQIFGGNLVPSTETAVGHAPQGLLPFPDDFGFRQNEVRTQDLEREEKAVLNLQAQEYDQLRILQRLDRNSDLYEHKLQQFKELSVMRAEAEKVLQEQKIERIKRDFEREKQDDDRNFQHQLWLENQKRAVLEGRAGGQPYQPPPQVQVQEIPQKPLLRPESVKSEIISQSSDLPQIRDEPVQRQPTIKKQKTVRDDQVMLSFDYAFNLPKVVRQLKVVSSMFNGLQPVGNAEQAGPSEAEPDQENKNLNKVFLNQKRIYKEARQNPDLRIVFELQAIDPNQQSGFIGIGWTWIDMFRRDNQQAIGSFTLPIYTGNTKPDLAMRNYQGRRPAFAPGVAMTVRVSQPGDELFDIEAQSIIDLQISPVPPEHQAGASQIMAVAPPSQASPPPAESLRKQSTIQKQPSIARTATVVKKLGRDPDYLTRGIKFDAHFVQNNKQYEKLTIRASLHLGGTGQNVLEDDVGQICEIKTPAVPEENSIVITPDQLLVVKDNKTSVQEKAQRKNIKDAQFLRENKTMGAIRPIEWNNTWDIDLHKAYWDQSGNKPVILLVEVFGKLEPGAKKTLLSFATHEVLKASDGKIKYGTFVVPLNKGPAVFEQENQEPINGERFGFTISDPDDLAAEDEEIEPDQRPQTPLISDQFIPNFEKQMTLTENFLPNDALDIYVDSTRHLPDNASLVKCYVQVVDQTFSNLVPPIENIADLENPKSSLRNQIFNLKVELRGQMKATALVFIQLWTFDKSTKKTCILGSSYFPLFLNSEGMPAIEDDISKHAPHLGQYQMPLYAGLPENKRPFNYEKFIYNERIPTSSILVRVVKAPKDEEGNPLEDNFENAPLYKAGVYRTQYFPLTDDERQIMALRRQRPDPHLKDVAQELLTQLKNTELEGQEKLDFLKQAIAVNAKSPNIDLNYFSQYEPSMGFRINVEAVHDNQTQGFFAVLATVVPPANYYKQQDNIQNYDSNSFIFIENDDRSRYCTVKFNEQDSQVQGYDPVPGMVVLFDIRIYLPDQDKWLPYGYAVLPLLMILEVDANDNTLEYFVGSGVFSLVVYKGAPSAKVIDILSQPGNPIQKIQSLPKSPLDNTSVIVRLVDSQRKTHFLQTFEQSVPSVRFIPQDLRSIYRFKRIEDGFFSSYAQLNTLVPAKFKGKKAEFQDYLLQKFKQTMKL